MGSREFSLVVPFIAMGRGAKKARMDPSTMMNHMMMNPMMTGWNPMMAMMMGQGMHQGMPGMMPGRDGHESSSDDEAQVAPASAPRVPAAPSGSSGTQALQEDAAAQAIHTLKGRRAQLFTTSADKIITRSAAMIRSLPKDICAQTVVDQFLFVLIG